MKIKTTLLLNILKHFKFIFEDNNYGDDDSKHIFFNIKDNTIWCYADVLVYTFSPTYSIGEIFGITDDIALPAKELFMLIKKIKSEDITVQQRGDRYIIRNGKSTNTFSIQRVSPDPNKWQEQGITLLHTLPEDTDSILKTFMRFEKECDRARNIIFEDGYMVSSDLYSFTKAMWDLECDVFSIPHNVLKHILQFKLNNFNVGDIMVFGDEEFSLYCKNAIEGVFEYKEFLDPVEEEVDLEHAITLEKNADIDFIDSFLLNYKKKEQKISVSVTEDKLGITALGYEEKEESRTSIDIIKYGAGIPEKFNINVGFFKDIYTNYDWFNILEGRLYCCNVENGVERLVVVENL